MNLTMCRYSRAMHHHHRPTTAGMTIAGAMTGGTMTAGMMIVGMTTAGVSLPMATTITGAKSLRLLSKAPCVAGLLTSGA